MNTLTSMLSITAAKAKVKAIKYGPAIAITTGLLGMGATVYLTYRAATKIEQAKRLRDEELNLVETYKENGEIDNEDVGVVPYSEADAERDTKIYNSRFIVTCVKHAAPAVLTFVFSAFLIGKGFKTMAGRAASLGAAVAGLTAQLADVKKELDDAVGKEKANDIFLGKSTHTETEMYEDGSVESKTVTTTNRYVTGYTFEFSKASSPMLFSACDKTNEDFITGNLRHANWYVEEKKGYVTFADILNDFEVSTDGCGYALTAGSVKTPGYKVIFDVDKRHDDDGNPYYIISVNLQGYIANQI